MAIPLKYNVRSLFVRKVTTLVTAGGIALMVAVTILLLALVFGLQSMLVTTSSPNNFIALRRGATSESVSFLGLEQFRALQYLSGIARNAEGEPLVSPELIVQPLCETQQGQQEVILIRGVTQMGFRVHHKVQFIAGRAPEPSLGEAAVGIAASRRYQGAGLGEQLTFGRREWKVVGIFTAEGSAFESEVWVDITDLFNDSNYGAFSAIRFTVTPETDRDALVRRIDEDQRISLSAEPEDQYYSKQAESADTLYLLTVTIAGIMGIGAVFGAMNTMYAAVSARTAEIGTLRALGFRRGAILASFVTEALCLAVLGYVAGVFLGSGAVVLVNNLLQGIALSLSTYSTAVVSLRLSLVVYVIALALAVLLGLIGGFFPAWSASRLRITDALRRA